MLLSVWAGCSLAIFQKHALEHGKPTGPISPGDWIAIERFASTESNVIFI